MTESDFYWQHFDLEATPFKPLRQAQKRGSLPPVVLFSGRKGIGKRPVAIFAAALSVCESNTACGHCLECRAIQSDSHPEVKVFFAEEKFSTEMAESLQEHLSMMPQTNGPGEVYRIAVISDAERMTLAAANRLLKTLEEPHTHARIFLTSSRTSDLPQTVLSRCVQMPVPPPAIDIACEIGKSLCQGSVDEQVLKSQMLTSGCAPWEWLNIHEGNNSEQQVADQILKIISHDKRSFPEVLDFCESVLKSEKPQTVVKATERALNFYYKNLLAKNIANRDNILTIDKRRKLIREVQSLAGKKKIHLNSQLAAESLLFSRI